MTGLLTNVSNNVLIIDFQETKILDQEVVDTIGKELADLSKDPMTSKILLDMNRIELMTSAMIGNFVAFNKKCKEQDVVVKMCNLTSEIAELFKITRLDSVFDIHDSRESAMHSFQEH